MHATYPEHARLKAVASPASSFNPILSHSHIPGDCTPPVSMPPIRVMDRFEAQGEAFNAQMKGITSGNRALAHAARELYHRITDNNDLTPVDEDGVYACIVAATALETTPQALPEHVNHFREVSHVSTVPHDAAEELHNVRTILRGRRALQSLAGNAYSHSRPWRTHRLDGTARDAGRWRKVPVLAGCCRG